MYTQNDKERTFRVLCLQPRLQKWSRKPVGTVASLLGDWAQSSPAHAQSSNANHAPLIVNSVQLAEQSGSHGVGGATVIAVNPAEIAEIWGEKTARKSTSFTAENRERETSEDKTYQRRIYTLFKVRD